MKMKNTTPQLPKEDTKAPKYKLLLSGFLLVQEEPTTVLLYYDSIPLSER